MLKLKCKKGGDHSNPADFEVYVDGKKVDGLRVQSITVCPGKKVVKATVTIFDAEKKEMKNGENDQRETLSDVHPGVEE